MIVNHPRELLIKVREQFAHGRICMILIIAFCGGELTVKIHIVQPGETIESVAERYGISVEKLLEANDLSESDSLEAGMKVRIPTGRVPVAQQTPAAEPAGERPKHRPEPPKKETRPPKKEHRPPKKEYRPPKKENPYPNPSPSPWVSPDRSPWRESPPYWMSPWETPRRYPYPSDERYPEPGYPRPETPRHPAHHPGYPHPHRPMMPPMPHPVYPWTPCCYPCLPFPMMPMPYPMMPGPYMYPPPKFPCRGMESDSVWYDSLDSSWEGSVRTHEAEEGSSATDIWDSREN
ncbi:MAG: LysM peptidoglycan-binding domain-containing protein [Thermoactinomycetaceae bacterium]|jgi:morphogenetic protein associated with SpoVID|nr:LysM peptidoglycan-binding domain-containing protein [Thermoactinomycetaceae bacterium]